MSKKPTIYFVLSVDTEEEWDWQGPFPEENCDIENVKLVPKFQAFCNRLKLKPTYFFDYAAAQSPNIGDLMREDIAQGNCEIGAHLHPWSNPPYTSEANERNSHVINMPIADVDLKLQALLATLKDKFNKAPTAFRTGRWGINGEILQLLIDNGFKVDSSIIPFYENDYFSCMDAPTVPYYPMLSAIYQSGQQTDIAEVPVTAGFNISNFALASKLHQRLSKAPFSWVKTVGLLWQSNLLKKLYLSPEMHNEKDLLSLADCSIKNGSNVIHMYLHSSHFLDNSTGFFNEENGFNKICSRIEYLVKHLERNWSIEPVCLSNPVLSNTIRTVKGK